MSIIITTIITLGAAVVIGIQIVQGVQPNPLAEGIVFATLGGSLNLIGVHTGISTTITGLNAASMTPAPVNPPAIETPVPTQKG